MKRTDNLLCHTIASPFYLPHILVNVNHFLHNTAYIYIYIYIHVCVLFKYKCYLNKPTKQNNERPNPRDRCLVLPLDGNMKSYERPS